MHSLERLLAQILHGSTYAWPILLGVLSRTTRYSCASYIIIYSRQQFECLRLFPSVELPSTDSAAARRKRASIEYILYL